MKPTRRKLQKHLALGALALGAAASAQAQYTPPPPPIPFPGFINQWMRQENPYLAAWDIGGNLRLRYEIKDGYGNPGVGSATSKPNSQSLDFRKNNADVENDYLMSKLRFHIGYTDKWWSAYVEARSSIVGGDERLSYFANPLPAGTKNRKGSSPESDTLDLHQAYITVGNHKEFPLSLKIGRQELSYGEERLVGAFAWNNIGRVFDAAKLRWQNEWFAADFFAGQVVIPEDDRFNVSNDHDLFSGVYATSQKISHHLLDLYFLARNADEHAIADEPSPQFPQPSARDIYTVGLRFKSKPGEVGNWDYSLESAYQFGNFQDRRLGLSAPRLTQDAWMMVLQGGYTFNDAWGTPRLGLEYSYASGDSNVHDKTHGTFENLFPTNHKFYGYMDFISLQNIHDLRGEFTIKPHPRVSLALEGHGFWLADTHDNFYNVGGAPRGGATLGANVGNGNGYGVNPSYSNFVGTEMDVIAGFAVNKFTQLEAGYGHFFAGDYINQSLAASSRGSRDANFFYLQLSVNF